MLTVYRASAGAGKTHKLTGEYIKLLFTAPMAYRHILAVTFTNKATDEMKGRIVEELYRLSASKPSQYVDELSAVYGLDEKSVRRKAKAILTSILHDYGSFNISTIDRFFQQTMRAFTREIGMQGGYAIEMDQELVLTAAVDNLLVELDSAGSGELLDWLLRFASEKVEGGNSWNLEADIISLGKELFKENYKAACMDGFMNADDRSALETYRNDLYAIVQKIEGSLKELGERALNLMMHHGLKPSDFSGTSRSPMFFFLKMANGEMTEPTATFRNLAGNIEKWYKKSDSREMISSIETAYNGGLNACVAETVAIFDSLVDYQTAKEILRYYYTLGILTDVAKQIAAYRSEKNIMLIADTTELLSRIIDGSDTPFIYEKTGTRVDHYMIDEFQDTSRMQWNNFQPLLAESLAHGRDNLVVGDVKQSIYRFRNSDWKLLDGQIQKDFRADQLREETLEDNWRSSKEIVNFNNLMFETASEVLQSTFNAAVDESTLGESERQLFSERITAAYSHSSQSVPKPMQNSAGYVSVTFIPEEEEDRNWKDESLNTLPSTVERLQDCGYELKDIAILVRTNSEGAMVANSLLSYREESGKEGYRYDIISDDALYVGSSSTVRFLISMLRYLNSPASPSFRKIAVFAYYYISEQTGEVRLEDFPEDIKSELSTLSRYALYETIEALFRIFSIHFPDNEQVFVQAFLDMALEYAQRENSDADRFLKWWDSTGCKKTIATPDGQNAIRIMTIHKSKGLGFKIVIVPFCDWEIDHRAGGSRRVILWCRPTVSPFNRLSLVPLNYSSKLSATHFAKEYFEERLQAGIDNLNMLYVAFTRAKEELIVLAPLSRKQSKVNSIAGLLHASLESGFNFQDDGTVFELGSPSTAKPESDKREAEEIAMRQLRSVSPAERLRLRLHSQNITIDDSRRKHGALMHDILSFIRTDKDILPAVESYRIKGVIGKEESQKIASELERLINQKEISRWFDGSSRVINEAEILSDDTYIHRPDRVMIKDGLVTVVDYKFGEIESSSHHKQVRNYMRLISRMGYERVEGYLWYVSLDKIEAVV